MELCRYIHVHVVLYLSKVDGPHLHRLESRASTIHLPTDIVCQDGNNGSSDSHLPIRRPNRTIDDLSLLTFPLASGWYNYRVSRIYGGRRPSAEHRAARLRNVAEQDGSWVSSLAVLDILLHTCDQRRPHTASPASCPPWSSQCRPSAP